MPYENNIHIFAPPCNILYIHHLFSFLKPRVQISHSGLIKVFIDTRHTKPSNKIYDCIFSFSSFITKRLQIMSWTSLAKAIVYVLIFRNKTLSTYMICRSKSGKICSNYSERLILWRSVPIPSDQSYYSNIKKCQTNLDLSLFFAWSAAMHISWNIRNFAHEKKSQSPQVATGFFLLLK